jgi:ATP phosphoribosyltransferase
MKNITVEVRDVYGQVKFYPTCDSAKLFADIAGTKTLTADALKKIEALGYAVTATRTVTY